MENQIQQIKSLFEGHSIKVTNSDGSRFIVECHDHNQEAFGLLFYINTRLDYYEIQECSADGNEYFGAAEEFYSFEDIVDYVVDTYQ